MDKIYFPATNSTPFVSFVDDRKLVISGRSISENEITFYKPLIAWASVLQVKLLEVDVDLEYVNSRSSKKLFQLFKVMDVNPDIKTLIINWYYDEGDEHAFLKGQVYQEALSKARFSFHMNTDPTDH
jgi:SiaC family regulatory phosphoprotein